MKRGFKSRANKLSKGIRKKMGLKIDDYLNPRLLAEKMDVKIIDPIELNLPSEILETLLSARSDEWSALGAHISEKPTIFLNTSHPETRIEASIMHELAHFILKHEP
ncbi:MAG: ImmA/IrrE family metallo-endopeptidase, partial [Candidatus Paceibacterota bacterium]